MSAPVLGESLKVTVGIGVASILSGVWCITQASGQRWRDVLAHPSGKAALLNAVIIACFDDTGLDDLRAAAHCPVIGIGQAAYVTAALAYGGFAVVTTLQVSVPVLEENIARYGLSPACTTVLASGLPVLVVEQGGEAVRSRLSDSITDAVAGGAKAVALGCAGMAHLRSELMARTQVPLVDGVAASAHLARALVDALR